MFLNDLSSLEHLRAGEIQCLVIRIGISMAAVRRES